MKIYTARGKKKMVAIFGVRCAAIFVVMTLVMTMVSMNAIIPTVSADVPKGPEPVDLGTAGDFVILSKAGISTTGTTSIVGDIGVSPIAATGITGFGLIMDSSNEFSTSSLVTGRVYAADYAVPTPSKMTTAVSDMETAYTTAAGLPVDYTELYGGDLTGQTLTTGVYKWDTGVLISAAGVTLSGNASDVWVFQIAQDLTLANGANVYLSPGVQAANIFWKVTGQVTIGTTAVMKGIILGATAIVLNTGATLEGRALAQTAVTLDSNIVYTPGTTVIPPISDIDPLPTGYWNNTGVVIVPWNAVDETALASVSLMYNYSAYNVTWGGWTWYAMQSAVGTIAHGNFTFTCPSQGYYRLRTNATDAAGNAEIALSDIARFAYDGTAPTVSSTVPANAATGVAINSAMAATFSEAMDPLTITNVIFTLKETVTGTAVAGTVSYSSVSAVFIPLSNLTPSTQYTVTIKGGVSGAKDLAGNPLASDYVWSWTTGAAPDITGTISGRIVDGNGNPIEGANVSVDGTSIFDITNASGGYTLTNVPAGAQKLNISMVGYQSRVVNVSVAPDATTAIPDIVLQKITSPPKDWSWLIWLLPALIVILIIAAMLYSRRKKSHGPKSTP